MSRLPLLALALVAGLVHGQDKPRDIPVSDIGGKYRLVGWLGRPLGTVLTVQGVVVEGPSKGYEGGPNICVQRINGRATQEYIQIKLDVRSSTPSRIQVGKSYEVEGYEHGEFLGVPRQPPKNFGPGTDYTGNVIGIQAPAYYLAVRFVMSEEKKIDPVRFSPADFVGREALFEGRAVNDGTAAYIAGDGWWLRVDPNKPWAKEFTGKTVEGFGLIEKSDMPKDWLLKKGTTRLVRLEDQVGRRVALRGTAWRSDGDQWLSYRGVVVYIGKRRDLPDWDAVQYGSPVIVEGELAEAMLPDIQQGDRESGRELKKYFVVRKPTWKALDALLAPEREK